MVTAYDTNYSDVKRMLLLKEPNTGQRETAQEAKTDSEEREEQRARVEDANIGQLHEQGGHELLGILTRFEAQDLFPRNPKVVPVFHGKGVELTFNNENGSPVAAKQQLPEPHQAGMLQDEVARMVKVGI